MQNFLKHIDKIKKRISNKENIILLFDFDGTLSPIVEHPDDAVLPEKWRKYLTELDSKANLKIGIVTGRAYSDVEKRLGLEDVLIAANHGCEIWKAGKQIFKKGDEHKVDIDRFGRLVDEEFANIAGLIIEKKDYSIAVHYRMVKSSLQDAVIDAFIRISEELIDDNRFEIMRGKKLLEIRPKDFWDKGKAVTWISENYAPDSYICYFGDDVTDEDAFKAVGNKGLTVMVGQCTGSFAEYYIDEIEDAKILFDYLLSRPEKSKR